MDLRNTGTPAAEPVTLAEAKAHLRVDGTAEDSLIALWIQMARQAVEAATGRGLLAQDWELWLDGFPAYGGAIELPRAPLLQVLSVTTSDAAGVATTLFPTVYQVVQPSGPFAQPGRILPAAGTDWPATDSGVAGAVRVSYRIGYASQGDVPAPLRAAILLMVGDLYANREAQTERPLAENPTVCRLLAPYRIASL